MSEIPSRTKKHEVIVMTFIVATIAKLISGNNDQPFLFSKEGNVVNDQNMKGGSNEFLTYALNNIITEFIVRSTEVAILGNYKGFIPELIAILKNKLFSTVIGAFNLSRNFILVVIFIQIVLFSDESTIGEKIVEFGKEFVRLRIRSEVSQWVQQNVSQGLTDFTIQLLTKEEVIEPYY